MPKLTIRRLYYTGRDIRELAQISSHTLRIWEEKFPLIHPSKSKSGRRLFKQHDLDTLIQIKKLKEAGYKNSKIMELLHNADNLFNLDEVIEKRQETEKQELISMFRRNLKDILRILDEK